MCSNKDPAQPLKKKKTTETLYPLYNNSGRQDQNGAVGPWDHLPEQTQIKTTWASLVTQWSRISLPMQETQVRSLIQEDPTCQGATKPVCQLLSPSAIITEAHAP